MSILRALYLSGGERVAVVGCGGKSTLIQRLAKEQGDGVLIAPTTRIALSEACGETTHLGRIEGNKLVAAPLEDIEAAAKRAALTLMEADGSRRLPLKGWAPHEPVVPGFTTLTLGVVSARSVGLVASSDCVHRLPLFQQITGLCEGDVVGAEAVASMILWCMNRHSKGRSAIWVNQVEDEQSRHAATAIARCLGAFDGIVLMGSALEGTWQTAN